MSRRWTLRLTACVVGASAVLAGCSEKQEAQQSLPSTSSAAPSTTEALPPLGPAAFPVPPEARAKTADGAVEFVRYYVTLTKYLADHGLDPEPLLTLSQDCRSCSNIAASLTEDREANYTYLQYDFEFDEYGPALIEGDTAQMGFTYIQGPVSVVDQAGAVVEDRSSATREKLESGAILLWRSDQQTWVLTALTVG